MPKQNIVYPLPKEAKDLFKKVLIELNSSKIPYVIGGAFAVHYYSSVWRNTKDLDLFITPEHTPGAMNILAKMGFETWIKHKQWLAKATKDPYWVDVIFGMGNWVAPIDNIWFDKANSGKLFGVPTLFAPPEEMIWAKAFVATKERFDWGDVYHIIQGTEGKIDWVHLLERFKDHWGVLLSCLTLFDYLYPSDKDYVPDWIFRELTAHFWEERARPWAGGKLCRASLVDPIGTFSLDYTDFGYRDAREEIWKARRDAPKTPRLSDHAA